jgi:hypothetical protein
MESVIDNECMAQQHETAGAVKQEPKLSERDKREAKRYLREFLPPMVTYGLVLAAVMIFVDQDSPSAKFWILLPVLPMIGVAVAVYRSLQRADEYARLLQVESMALGFGAACLGCLVFGFLGVAGVALTWSPWVIFGAAMATWGISLGVRGGAD